MRLLAILLFLTSACSHAKFHERRVLDPIELEPAPKIPRVYTMQLDGANHRYQIRKVESSSVGPYCLAVLEVQGEIQRPISKGCYGVGQNTIRFDDEESIVRGGTSRYYGFIVTVEDDAKIISRTVRVRAIVEVDPQ